MPSKTELRRNSWTVISLKEMTGVLYIKIISSFVLYWIEYKLCSLCQLLFRVAFDNFQKKKKEKKKDSTKIYIYSIDYRISVSTSAMLAIWSR
jgi:hypothetical protein